MKRILSVILATVMMVFAFGCATQQPDSGAATPGEASPGNNASQPEPAANDANTDVPTVKLGIIVPLTGESAYPGQMGVEGATYCADVWNARGGIKSLGGAQIEVFVADSTGSVDTAISEFERLVNNQNIDILAGPYNSAVATALAPLCEKYQIPFVTFGSSGNAYLLDPNYTFCFRAGDNNTTNTECLLGFAKEMETHSGKPIKKIAYVFENVEWGVDQSGSNRRMFEAAGYETVMTESFETDASDFSGLVTKLKNSGADLVLPTIASFNPAVLFSRALSEYDCTIPVLHAGGITCIPEFIEALGADAEYLFSVDTWNVSFLSGGNAEAVELAEGYIEKYGHKMGEQSGIAWQAAMCLFSGVEAAGSTDGVAVRDAIEKLELKKDDWEMLLFPYEGVKFSTADNPLYYESVPDEGLIHQNIYTFSMISQVIDGEWRSVYPDSALADNPLVYPIPE